MPLVKDNALVAAASEKYKIKQFGKTLNTTGVNGLVVNEKQHSSSSQYNKTNLIAA